MHKTLLSASKLVALVSSVFVVVAVQAQTSQWSGGLSVASFNMGWWASAAEDSALLQQCSQPTRQWCDTRYADTWPRVNGTAVCEATSPGMAPCNAHAVYDTGIGSSRTATTSALQVPTAAYFAARQRAMQATLRRVDADVLALQEISGVAAAREALGSLAGQYQFCESEAPTPQAQKLVIAWRNGITGACKTELALAVDDEPDSQGVVRKLRPALLATLQVQGKPVNVLNLHLKSGCASPAGDGFYTYQGDYLDSDKPACKTLRRQVPALEAVMKGLSANNGQTIVLGDFNRKLDMELHWRAGHVRAVGGRCGVPLKREERAFNPGGVAAASDAVCLMWPELIDGDARSGNHVLLRRHLQPEGQKCARNEGLDHITISQGLRSALLFEPMAEEVPLATFGQDKEPASDHCPLKAVLKFKP